MHKQTCSNLDSEDAKSWSFEHKPLIQALFTQAPFILFLQAASAFSCWSHSLVCGGRETQSPLGLILPWNYWKKASPTMLLCVSKPSASPLNIGLMHLTVPLKVITTGSGDFIRCARNFHHHRVRSSCWHSFLLILTTSTSPRKIWMQPLLTQRNRRCRRFVKVQARRRFIVTVVWRDLVKYLKSFKTKPGWGKRHLLSNWTLKTNSEIGISRKMIHSSNTRRHLLTLVLALQDAAAGLFVFVFVWTSRIQAAVHHHDSDVL